MKHFSYKGGCDVRGRIRVATLKEELAWAIGKQLWVVSNKMQLYH